MSPFNNYRSQKILKLSSVVHKGFKCNKCNKQLFFSLNIFYVFRFGGEKMVFYDKINVANKYVNQEFHKKKVYFNKVYKVNKVNKVNNFQQLY